MSEIKTIQQKNLIETFLAKKFRNTQSFSTRNNYGFAMRRFTEFLRLEKNLGIDQARTLLENKNLDPIELLDEFYTHLRNVRFGKKQKKYSNAAVRTYIIVAKEFLRFLGLKVYNEDIKQKFKLPPKQQTSEPGLEKNDIIRVLRNSPSNLQVAIVMCCAGGFRDGELVQLRLSDIDFGTNPTSVTLRAEVVKGKVKPRKTHLTNEATIALKDYLAKKGIDYRNPNNQDEYIFLRTHEERISEYAARIKELEQRAIHAKPQDAKKLGNQKGLAVRRLNALEKQLKILSPEELYYKAYRSAQTNFIQMLERVADSIPELSKRHENDIRDIHFHAFRDFFKTQVTDAFHSDFAESLMGHTNLKLTYYKKNDRKRMEGYRKCEASLTIADFGKIEKNISDISEDNQDLREQLKELQQQVKFLLVKSRPQKA